MPRKCRQQIVPTGRIAAARGPQQVAMLAFDLGMGQRLGQPQTGRLVGQGPVLADASLDLAGGRHQAGV